MPELPYASMCTQHVLFYALRQRIQVYCVLRMLYSPGCAGAAICGGRSQSRGLQSQDALLVRDLHHRQGEALPGGCKGPQQKGVQALTLSLG